MADDIFVDIGPMDASKAPKEHAAKVKGYMEATAEKTIKKAQKLGLVRPLQRARLSMCIARSRSRERK